MVAYKVCGKCGAAFKCGVTETGKGCWCTALPNIAPIPAVGDCLCPDCLKARIAEIENTLKNTTLPQ